MIYVKLRRHLGQVSAGGTTEKSRIEEGLLLADHVHILTLSPPKYVVSQLVGFIKWKSSIHLARVYGEKKHDFIGLHFWARVTLYPRSDGTKNKYGKTLRSRGYTFGV
jgi:putative transposase